MLKFYHLFIGSKGSFLKPFGGEGQEELYRQASLFWDKLDGCSIFFILLFLIIGGFTAWFYYKPFNEQPNRHYLPKYWWMFLVVSALVSLFITFGLAVAFAYPRINGTWIIELKIALQNAALAAFVYWIMSIFICKCCKTNAYKKF